MVNILVFIWFYVKVHVIAKFIQFEFVPATFHGTQPLLMYDPMVLNCSGQRSDRFVAQFTHNIQMFCKHTIEIVAHSGWCTFVHVHTEMFLQLKIFAADIASGNRQRINEIRYYPTSNQLNSALIASPVFIWIAMVLHVVKQVVYFEFCLTAFQSDVLIVMFVSIVFDQFGDCLD